MKNEFNWREKNNKNFFFLTFTILSEITKVIIIKTQWTNLKLLLTKQQMNIDFELKKKKNRFGEQV